MTQEPRIYVACLASYNAGLLFGQWLAVPEDVETLDAEIRQLLTRSPMSGAEEWAIHDYEGFAQLAIGEYSSSAEVVQLAQFVREHGALGAALAKALGSPESATRVLENSYLGAYESLEAWAEHHLEELELLPRVPDALRSYLDLERYARDLVTAGALMELRVDGSLHLFWTI